MEKKLVTDVDDVLQKFACSRSGELLLDGWVMDRPHVAQRVMRHRTEAVYKISSADIAELSSEHAIGNIRPDQGYGVKSIRDWFPDFAFSHIFHFCLEERGRVFSFQDFRDWSSLDRCRPLLYDPARVKIKQAISDGYTEEQAKNAMRWRVGLFYYSFIRELYVISRFRELGLDVRFHPLADALYRTDAWLGNVSVSLYIKNGTFRDGATGRKPQAEKLIGHDRPDLRFVELKIPTQRVWGRVHLPGEGAVEACAEQLRQLSA